MSEFKQTMNNSELSPRDSPRPMKPFASKITTTVPDISLLQNDYTSSSSLKNSTNSSELMTSQKYQYPQDSRLKFYQILQSNNRHNSLKVPNAKERTCSVVRNDVAVNNKNTSISSRFQQHSSTMSNSLKPHVSNQGDNRNDYISRNTVANTDPVSESTCAHNGHNENDGIKQLYELVEGQGQQLESLKRQINILLTSLMKFQDNVTKVTPQQPDNDVRSFESLKINQKHEQNKEMKEISTSNKVSIGVMTSFEFTIRNNLDVDITSPSNPCVREETCGKEPSHGENVNTLIGPLEKIIEKSEDQLSERSDHNSINFHQKGIRNVCIQEINDRVNNEVDESKISTKVGWTFYNNILCHVNEILHNSKEMSPSQTSYDIMQKSCREQIKILGTAITDINNGLSSNISDKMATFDSSYYPRVNYQTNFFQSSNSMVDPNASIHMQTLATKYLGSKYCQEPITERSKTNSIVDVITEHTMSLSTRNYVEQPKLNYNESPIVDDLKSRKKNILDISTLKRQPKLL